MEGSSSTPTLALLVIRTPDLNRCHDFYSLLGLSFSRESHGKGPEHFACDLDGFVFEIYPLQEGKTEADDVRLGFRVRGLDNVINSIKGMGITIHSEPKESPWGLRAVVEDPDGRKVELYQARN